MDKRELRARVRLRNAIPDTGDGLAGHTDIDDCITAAMADISGEYRWPWLQTSAPVTFTAGVAPIPADCVSVLQLTVNGYPAERVDLSEFGQPSRPFVWTDQGSTVTLWPVPSVAPSATLVYYRGEPELTTDVAVPLMPAVFHQLLVVRASYQLNVRRGDQTRAAQDSAEYQMGLRNLMQAGWRSNGPRRVQSAFRFRQMARW